MKLRIISLATFLLIFISQSYSQQTAQKKYCMSSIGYKGTSDELRAELLMEAKRLAVSEFFGEVISSYTKVEMYALTEDRIVSSSAGLVRIKGSPKFESGDSFGEVCVMIDAYVTEEDLDKFKPIIINKKHCISDPNLTASRIKLHAQKQAIITALIDYDRKLESRNEEDILALIHNIKYLESGFIPGTESYCVEFEGVIYPIEIFALGVEPIMKSFEKKVGVPGRIFFKEDFSEYAEGDPATKYGNGLVVLTIEHRKYLTAQKKATFPIKYETAFPKNFIFELTVSNPANTPLIFIDSNGDEYKIDLGVRWLAGYKFSMNIKLPCGSNGKITYENRIARIKIIRKNNVYKVYVNGNFVVSELNSKYGEFIGFRYSIAKSHGGRSISGISEIVGTDLGE